METESDIYITKATKALYSAWLLQNRRVSNLVNKLSEEAFYTDVSNGRNSGVYLLGHLIANNDTLLPLFGFGEKMFPEYEKLFMCTPDKCGKQFPSPKSLKTDWLKLNEILKKNFMNIEPEQWFAETTDKQQERFSVMLSVVTHQSYHLGQMAFLL